MVLRQEMQTTQKVHKTINLQKYIVYITITKSDKIYYIGKHIMVIEKLRFLLIGRRCEYICYSS